MSKRVEEQYFQFLKSQVQNINHHNLLNCLHNIDFYGLVPNDDNREIDGIKLREIFDTHERRGGTAPFLCQAKPCTMLEMLIGLAYRMENELSIGQNNPIMPECFWILIANLGLDWADDSVFQPSDELIIQNRVLTVISRSYMRNGNGGLFPLRRAVQDQRKVEIWYQMSAWILENFASNF